MKINRSARPGRPLTWAAVVALLLPAFLFVAAAPAQAANPHGCRTQVTYFANQGTTVGMKYRVHCEDRMERILVTAKVTDATTPVEYDNLHNTCLDAFNCSVSTTVPNPRGTQRFFALGINCGGSGGLDLSCATLAVAYDGDITAAKELACAAPCFNGGGLVVRENYW